jgi:hypothetical protein
MTERTQVETEHYIAGPVKTRHHLEKAVRFNPAEVRKAMDEVSGFNAKFAVFITKGVGSMGCAYLFSLIALCSLPAILTQANWVPGSTFPHFLISPGLILIVAWIAQTYIQLVLLSVIMVGQNVQSLAADARSANTFKDAETILDRLDVHTQGGLRDILDRLNEIAPAAAGTLAPSAIEPTREGA